MPILPAIGDLVEWVLGLFLAVQLSLVLVLWLVARQRRRRVPEGGIDALAPIEAGVDGNRVKIYGDGIRLYADMLHAIRGARRQILFETFIWKDGEVGQAFKAALAERAAAGVEVYVIYDTLANLVVPARHFYFPPQIRVLPYNAWRRPWHALNPRHWGRDHRKILVVDQQVGFTGGFNIGAVFRDEWRDTHMRVEGPAARDLAYAFVDFWNARSDPRHPALAQPLRPWSPYFRVHRNDPAQLLFPIRSIYIEAIEHAHRRIRMTHAYFVPDPAIRAALLRAARRGVDVQILVPWQSNHVLVDWLSRHLYERMLGGGVRLFVYEGGMIHSKTATIDGVWSMVGTANMDRLSLAGNYEVNVEVFDVEIARQLEAQFELDLRHAREISLPEWQRRPWYVRAGEVVLSPLWPLV